MKASKFNASQAGVGSSGSDIVTLLCTATRPSVTGTTAKTALSSVLIPAGMMGPNSALEIEAAFGVTGSTNSKITAISIGPTPGSVVELFTRPNTSAATLAQAPKITLINRGQTNSQVLPYSANSSYATNSTLGPTTLSIDFSIDQVVWFFGTLAVSTETIALDSAIVTIRNAQK